jgi:hypothetical protein
MGPYFVYEPRALGVPQAKGQVAAAPSFVYQVMCFLNSFFSKRGSSDRSPQGKEDPGEFSDESFTTTLCSMVLPDGNHNVAGRVRFSRPCVGPQQKGQGRV